MMRPWSDLLESETAPVRGAFEEMPQECRALYDWMVQHGYIFG